MRLDTKLHYRKLTPCTSLLYYGIIDLTPSSASNFKNHISKEGVDAIISLVKDQQKRKAQYPEDVKRFVATIMNSAASIPSTGIIIFPSTKLECIISVRMICPAIEKQSKTQSERSEPRKTMKASGKIAPSVWWSTCTYTISLSLSLLSDTNNLLKSTAVTHLARMDHHYCTSAKVKSVTVPSSWPLSFKNFSKMLTR